MIKSILHISDTHNCHRELIDLPNADMIIHSGDFCMAGTENEVYDFVNWFCDLPYKYKLFIAGNHDDCLYGADLSGLDKNCYYLCNSSIIIENLKLYGAPMFVQDMLDGKDKLNISRIPIDTDILITHQPPFGIFDFADNIHYGDVDLLQKVECIKPKMHLFGHIHSAYGIKKQNGIIYSNAALINYEYSLLSHTPILINC